MFLFCFHHKIKKVIATYSSDFPLRSLFTFCSFAFISHISEFISHNSDFFLKRLQLLFLSCCGNKLPYVMENKTKYRVRKSFLQLILLGYLSFVQLKSPRGSIYKYFFLSVAYRPTHANANSVFWTCQGLTNVALQIVSVRILLWTAHRLWSKVGGWTCLCDREEGHVLLSKTMDLGSILL